MHPRRYSQRNLLWIIWKKGKIKSNWEQHRILNYSFVLAQVWNLFHHILMNVVLLQQQLWSVDPKQEIIAFESYRNRQAAHSSSSAHSAGLLEIHIKGIKQTNGRSLLHIFSFSAEEMWKRQNRCLHPRSSDSVSMPVMQYCLPIIHSLPLVNLKV